MFWVTLDAAYHIVLDVLNQLFLVIIGITLIFCRLWKTCQNSTVKYFNLLDSVFLALISFRVLFSVFFMFCVFMFLCFLCF